MITGPVGYDLLSKVRLHDWNNSLQRSPRGNLENITLPIQVAHFHRRPFFQSGFLIIIARGHIDPLGQLDCLWPLARLDCPKVDLDS